MSRPLWVPHVVAAGSEVAIGPVVGPGLRATLAVRGGIDVPPYLGSRSTFTLGVYGGLDGRVLAAGDRLCVGDEVEAAPGELPPGLSPVLGHHWKLGVMVGPHAAPDFLTADGLQALLRTEWEVHFNSARTGVRLIGPRPRWARRDGGEAGLHPSNIHDSGYALGSVDLTGDMPVILGPDGPSLGGFVCPAVVIASERWKLGQLRPGDHVRLVAGTVEQAAAADRRRESWVHRATIPVTPVARPSWNTALAPGAARDDAVLARDGVPGEASEVTYRQAGDRFLLVEFGSMTLDLELRLRVAALDAWVRDHLTVGLIDVTPGIRSLLLQVDGRRLTTGTALAAMCEAVLELGEVTDRPSRRASCTYRCPGMIPPPRRPATRYVRSVRADAPWCGRHRGCLPVHLRHGGPRRLAVRRTDGAGLEPRPSPTPTAPAQHPDSTTWDRYWPPPASVRSSSGRCSRAPGVGCNPRTRRSSRSGSR